MRTFCILGAPLVRFRIAMDDVPAQVIHRDDLGRKVGFVALWPHNLPVAVVVHQLEILVFVERADGGDPIQAGTDDCLIAVVGDHPALRFLQMRERLQAAVASRNIVVQRRKIDVARGCNEGISAAIVIGLHTAIERLHSTLGRGRPLLLFRRSGARSDQHSGDYEHENRQNAAHYCASRRTTGSEAAVGKSMVSAMRRRSGKAISSASANTIVLMGSVPQSRLCSRVGTAPSGGMILCAGGTSSLLHSVMLPLS